jgi:hypothetical protein
VASSWYATREDVKRALNVAETARNDGQIDRAIESGSRSVEGLLHRVFRPVKAVRFFDWPNKQYAKSWRLWLGADEVISITTLTAGGVVIPAADYNLEPINLGPPYDRIEIDLSSSAAFSAGSTPQRSVSADGLFGFDNTEERVGQLVDTLAADETDTANITFTTARIGVGDVFRIDNERVIVTGRTLVDTTQNTGNALTATAADKIVQVTNGTAFGAEQVILVDAERMLVTDVAGNNVIVKRAWDGSALATHSSAADIFSLTGVDVARAQLGTTLASHSGGAAVMRHVVPGLVRELCIAEALNTYEQETSGYARTVGEGETEQAVDGRGLRDIRQYAKQRFGRQARKGAI